MKETARNITLGKSASRGAGVQQERHAHTMRTMYRMQNQTKYRDYPKEQVWFITLTYDDEHVPGMIINTGEIMRKVQYAWKPGEKRPESVQTLLYTDVQKFLKRLRKAYKSKLRYFIAGEYGEQTARPHYHMILYGWQPTDLEHLTIS